MVGLVFYWVKRCTSISVAQKKPRIPGKDSFEKLAKRVELLKARIMRHNTIIDYDNLLEFVLLKLANYNNIIFIIILFIIMYYNINYIIPIYY